MAAIAVIGIALITGAYLLGKQQAGQPETARAVPEVTTPVTAPAAPAAPVAGPLAPGAELPPGHRPLTPPGQQPATSVPAAQGKIKFNHFRVGNSNVKAILSDGKLMWVGTSNGVVRYDITTDKHDVFDVRSGLLSNGIFHLSKLDDRLVVGTYGGGLSLLDLETEKWEHFNIQHGLGDAFIYDFLSLPNGDIWIATWSGANRVRGGDLNDRSKWDLYTVANTDGGLPNDWVYGLAEGKDGEVWFATEGGLARFKDEKWQSWKHEDGQGAAYELVKDQIEFTRDPAKESSHHARQKVEMGLGAVDIAYNPNYIVALHVDDDGIVWVGTWGGGLARFDGTSYRNFTVVDGLPANHVFLLEGAGDGKLWVGTSNGLSRFDSKTFEVLETLTTADGLFANNIFSMDSARDGSLWVGSFGGVARLSGLGGADGG